MGILGRVPKGGFQIICNERYLCIGFPRFLSRYPCLDLENILVISFWILPQVTSVGEFSF